MMGYVNFVGGKVETLVTFVIGGIPQENTASRARRQLMGHRGREVQVAGAAKDSQMCLIWWGAKESKVGSAGRKSFGG